MSSAEYWRQRFAAVEEEAQRQADVCVEEIAEIYRDAERSVQADLERWYGRFADNNGIGLIEAKKLLTSGQLEEFRWTVEQYIEAGRQAGLSPEWLKKLENASARFHISRLESIQLQIQQQAELLYGGQLDSVDRLLRDVASGGYTRTAFAAQKGLGLAWDITALDKRRLDRLLARPWTTDGKTFRDRCWTNKAGLVSGLQSTLTQGLLRGDSPQKMTDSIKKQFGVDRYRAGRLVHTETAYFTVRSQLETFREMGVEKVEILETLDRHTCEICGGLDGKVLPLSQCEPGVTVPPFHPNCRGDVCPYYDDMDGERAARNAEGEIYYVPEDMTYREWEKAFVEGGEKSGLRLVVTDALKLPSKTGYEDVKGKWYLNAKPNSHPVKDLHTYAVNGTTYTVDGHNVVLDYSPHEKEIAELLEQEIGGEIFMVPRVNNPQGVKTPDYLFHGNGYDLKTIGKNAGENTIFNRVKKAVGQTRRFIIDLDLMTPQSTIKLKKYSVVLIQIG